MRILGLETSFDETAAAIVADGKTVLAKVTATSTLMHRKYGGVVPSLAKREHQKNLVPVLVEALKEAKERGVEVKVILDRLPATSKYSQKQNLTESGISTRIMLQKTMHNKFVVIDNELVLTGSFNWTSNADEKNDENLVFLADKKIASQYSEEFFELWIEAG